MKGCFLHGTLQIAFQTKDDAAFAEALAQMKTEMVEHMAKQDLTIEEQAKTIRDLTEGLVTIQVPKQLYWPAMETDTQSFCYSFETSWTKEYKLYILAFFEISVVPKHKGRIFN